MSWQRKNRVALMEKRKGTRCIEMKKTTLYGAMIYGHENIFYSEH
jgi:hypothetical protein